MSEKAILGFNEALMNGSQAPAAITQSPGGDTSRAGLRAACWWFTAGPRTPSPAFRRGDRHHARRLSSGLQSSFCCSDYIFSFCFVGQATVRA